MKEEGRWGGGAVGRRRRRRGVCAWGGLLTPEMRVAQVVAQVVKFYFYNILLIYKHPPASMTARSSEQPHIM